MKEWKCKFCEKTFDYDTTTLKGNHARWCESNPNRNNTNGIKKAMKKFHDNNLGEISAFDVFCDVCGDLFVVNERAKTFPKQTKYYCSRKCSCSVGGRAKADKYPTKDYRIICFKYHKRECVVCKENKLVEVHHLNHDRNDGNPYNLIPLCPTHHRYWHSQYRNMVENDIFDYVKNCAFKITLN